MSLYARSPIGETSTEVLINPAAELGSSGPVAIEKHSLWVELPEETVKTCRIYS
jgi:hypothetical protein